MTQTLIEKKLCSLSANIWRQNLVSLMDKKLGIAESQELKTNMTLWCRIMPQVTFDTTVLRVEGKEIKFDAIPAGGKDSVRRGGSDA